MKAWSVYTVAAQSQLQPTVLVSMLRVRRYDFDRATYAHGVATSIAVVK